EDDFKNILYNKNISDLRGVEGYENHFILHKRWWPKFLPKRKVLVPKESAAKFLGAPVHLRDTDHFSTVKPDYLRHPGHELLANFIINDFLKQSARRTETFPTAAPRSISSEGRQGGGIESLAAGEHLPKHLRLAATLIDRSDQYNEVWASIKAAID